MQSGKSLEKWKSTRAKGAWNFILFRGVLGWGGLMFVIMGVVFPLIEHTPRALTPRGLAISFAICLIGGLLWGALVWLCMEWIFRKQLRTER